MNMRERIARALFEHWAEEDFANEYCSWDLLPGKDQWLDRADAVLAAMREPAFEMKEAARIKSRSMEPPPLTPNYELAAASDVWQAMIDAASADPAIPIGETR